MVSKQGLKYVMTGYGLTVYDKDKPLTVRFNRKETNEMLKREVDYSKYDHHCEVAHLEVSNTCFRAGTLVYTPSGPKKIENLKKGNSCWVYENEIKEGTVKNISKKEYIGNLIEIKLFNNKKIWVTPEHEFYTTNRGWVAAKELSTNDELADMQNLSGEIRESI